MLKAIDREEPGIIDIAEDPDPEDFFITNIEILSVTMDGEVPIAIEGLFPENFDPSATDIKLGAELLAFNGVLNEFYVSGCMEIIDGEEQPLINELQFIAYGGLYHNLIEVNETEILSQNYEPEEWNVAFEE